MRRWTLGLLGSLLLAAPAQAATGTEIADKTVDAVLFRPLGFFSTVVGAVMFVPATVIASPMGRDAIDEAKTAFIDSPYESTFERPLGDF